MEPKKILEQIRKPENIKWLLWGAGGLAVAGLVVLGGGLVRKNWPGELPGANHGSGEGGTPGSKPNS